MLKFLFFPVRLAVKACKGTAMVLALILMVVLLLPKTGAAFSTSSRTCPHEEENLALREVVASQAEELNQLRQALDTEYELCRRIDLRFFGQDWLTLRTVSFWDNVGYSHYEASPEDTQETIWTSLILDLVFTTTERRSTG